MKFSPGCGCCIDCTHLPDQLYLRSTNYGQANGATVVSHAFTYDAASGLWVVAITVPGNPGGGLVYGLSLSDCTGTGTYTTFVYQMNAARQFVRQLETCSLDSNGNPNAYPENSAPADLTGAH